MKRKPVDEKVLKKIQDRHRKNALGKSVLQTEQVLKLEQKVEKLEKKIDNIEKQLKIKKS